MILLDYLVQNVGLYLSNDANGAASVLVPHGRTIRADMRLQNKLLNHRELYAPFCAFIVNYLSGINKQTGSNETAYASFVPAQIALSAVDMDIHDGGHCAQQITPFFASRPDDRDYAFSLCIGGYENPHRPQSACNVIKENVKPEEKTVRP
ncbi:hypothetical protein NO263_01845 [Gluconacetobacter entanii]|uniref:Uncharacterized protein n=1 Tax=Gluconacetobacter entanii TaxID=108528 RepID=A0ABT3K1Q0_9PROT|nr:hypothetical protein [Gluconacetobacter entanii]MCW4589331.1 hypothetical protein [Gluconacetobacter entanii]MCW4592912.1 hypothetical protein [Gluconacetobacter entanii]NPC89518.1 hypothetical protein [Gluconacetobacter entanii]